MPDQFYAAIDLETTGLKSGRDEIIEVGIVRCTPDEVLDTFSSLVRPLEMPGLRVQRLTGIDLDELAAAPEWHEVEEQVTELLDGATLIGHNIDFDLKFLREAGIRLSTPAVDTLELARIVDPLAPTHRLGDLCERYGITGGEAHRALSDAEAARQVFLELRKRFDDLPMDARDEISEVISAADMFWTAGRVISQWMLASGRVGGPNVPKPELPPQLEPVALPNGSLAELTERAFASLEADGLDRREEQLNMARDVANTLQHGGTLIVEAGTGTGKSLAYLVPAAFWALKTGNTVLISTHTMNLQQQLADNDVELARRLISSVSPEAAKALVSTVVKGRGNYLCQDVLDREVARAGNWEEPSMLARTAAWRHMSKTGDQEELRLPPEHSDLWPQLSAARTRCLSDENCIYRKNGSCFILRVQQRAARSHIVIVNHALMVIKTIYGAALVPDAPVAIIDEAHSLEGVATDQLTNQMTESWIMEKLLDLTNRFDRLGGQVAGAGFAGTEVDLNAAAIEAEHLLADLFDRIAEFVAIYRGNLAAREDSVILTAGMRSTPKWEAIVEVWEQARVEMLMITATLRRIADNRDGDTSGASPAVPEQLMDAEAQEVSLDLLNRIGELEDVISKDSNGIVYWIEQEIRRSELVTLHSAPVSVAQALQPLWPRPVPESSHAAVLTGATMDAGEEVGAHFRPLRRSLGIEDAEEERYSSPFDYVQNARMFLPIDAPFPGDSGYDDFVADAVKQLTIAASGRTMVLFRSYRALNYTAKKIARGLELAGITLLLQGRDGSPARVVEALKADSRSVVFGVASLWTGVDVPGDPLSLLIVPRLPFDPPTDPIKNARAEQYNDPFNEYTIPNALIQFRQGIGRLIRTKTDIGAAVILDVRMLRMQYGVRFRRTLPPAPLIDAPLNVVVAEVKRFLPPPERAP